MGARVVAWVLLLGGLVFVERISAGEPAGVRMLALVAHTLFAMKVLVVQEEVRRGMPPLPPARWLCFAAGWLGMQPRLFARRRPAPLAGAGDLLRRGALCAVAGESLVLLAWLSWPHARSLLLASLLLLPCLSLLLHFGLCNALAGGWRLAGFPCDALFRAPLRSRSLGEFWSRRWNLAFSEMTSIAIYRPLVARWGRNRAIFAGFVVSGLLHEVAISLPVRAGFGLPTLYFLLHGSLVLVERSLARRGRPLRGWAGRAWTLLWLALPLPLLFHPPFLAGVVWPLIGASP